MSTLQKLQRTLTIQGTIRPRFCVEKPLLQPVRITRALESNSTHDWLNQRKVNPIAQALRTTPRNAIPRGGITGKPKPGSARPNRGPLRTTRCRRQVDKYYMFNFTWNSLRKVTHVEQPRPESGAVTDLRCIYDRIGLISFLRHVEGFILA
jgi:hypothetical protein